MSRVVLLTGSNTGDKAALLQLAAERIEERIGTIVRKSGVYESEAWGFRSDDVFLNQALIVETEFAPIRILDEIQSIEKELGRVRKELPGKKVRRYESRTIDIDILFYDDLILKSERLTIPHPLIPEREFVLVPLREILNDYIHPTLRKPLKEL